MKVNRWEETSSYDGDGYLFKKECPECQTEMKWGVFEYSNGFEDWANICPKCGFNTGGILDEDGRVTNIYSRKYPNNWYNMQWPIRLSVDHNATDNILDMLVAIYKATEHKFVYISEPDSDYKLDLPGIYCSDIGDFGIEGAGDLLNKIGDVLDSYGYKTSDIKDWTESGTVGDGGLFTSKNYWTETWRRLCIRIVPKDEE
jgi:hypothetical protein